MIRPRLPVIPSAARNLKSITARPDSQCRAYVVTKSENSVRTLYVGRTLGADTLDSSTPLRPAQNDRAGGNCSESVRYAEIVLLLSFR